MNIKLKKSIGIIAVIVLLLFGALLGISIYKQTSSGGQESINTSIAAPKVEEKLPREVKSVSTNAEGDLIISYTDNTSENAGHVVADETAPSKAQISAALLEYCSGGRCDSKAPTQDQIIAALAVYCSGGICKGEPGDSPTPITPEQIAASVASYCADGRCKGADGQSIQGPIGANGQPPVSWRFTYLATEYECKRAEPFDPGSPTYTCEPVN